MFCLTKFALTIGALVKIKIFENLFDLKSIVKIPKKWEGNRLPIVMIVLFLILFQFKDNRKECFSRASKTPERFSEAKQIGKYRKRCRKTSRTVYPDGKIKEITVTEEIDSAINRTHCSIPLKD